MSFLLCPMRRTASNLPSTARAFSTSRARQLARMTLVGRIGADPEVKQTNGGASVIEYPVATSYGPKDNRQTSWYRISSFAPEESSARSYTLGLSKGTLVYLEADARMKQYEDSEGKTRSALALYQTKVEVLKRPLGQHEGQGEGSATGV